MPVMLFEFCDRSGDRNEFLKRIRETIRKEMPQGIETVEIIYRDYILAIEKPWLDAIIAQANECSPDKLFEARKQIDQGLSKVVRKLQQTKANSRGHSDLLNKFVNYLVDLEASRRTAN
jgi:hypothetical protein